LNEVKAGAADRRQDRSRLSLALNPGYGTLSVPITET
jgi:hypothetical protein